MKYETYSEYNPVGVASAESAFLTVWAGLGSWHSDLVLVGGLVPKYLCGDLSASRTLPRPVTVDADLGISLGASLGQYGSLQSDLQAQGFRLSKDEFGGPRFVKKIGDFTIPVDFLTEHPPATQGTAVVDDIPANILPGINRALASARTMKVKGIDLYGAPQELTVRVCEVGPFLAMKLRAFARRQAPKDVFDILYTLLHYDRGTKAAVAAFGEEVRAGNPACTDAVACLNQHFRDEQSSAPVRAANFVLGQAVPGESEDIRFRRLQIQQDMVDAGALLRKAIA
ncbi:MAG: hypothetical protein FJ398_27085 [Verrucomicrobia bacterium]|nr:hypothetical protein [Verrucomicrobiota bacterium]